QNCPPLSCQFCPWSTVIFVPLRRAAEGRGHERSAPLVAAGESRHPPVFVLGAVVWLRPSFPDSGHRSSGVDGRLWGRRAAAPWENVRAERGPCLAGGARLMSTARTRWARSASQGEDDALRAEPEAGGRVAPRKVGDAGRAMPGVGEEHREAADNLN